MKPTTLKIASWTLLFPALAMSALAQGALTPPGPPGPTMKSLDQIEARTIVNATSTPGDAQNTFIISQPGSYYLAGNVTGAVGKHGISIRADNVTLDLNGFALISGGGGATRGVSVPAAQSNLSVGNGTIRGWTDGGVRADGVRATRAEKLILSNNTGSIGLIVGLGSLIHDCVANGNGIGFQTPDRCQLFNCIATENTDNGFQSTDFVTIVDCTSSRNEGSGFKVGSSGSIERCGATRNGFYGISAGYDSRITDCTVSNNGSSGIFAFNGRVNGCTASHNGSHGILFAPSAGPLGNDGIASGSVSNCSTDSNGLTGITASGGTVTNCSATANGDDGISVLLGVVAFCRAYGNNLANNGGVDIDANGSVRTGNNPEP